MKVEEKKTAEVFLKAVQVHKTLQRDLPWRKTEDPYAIAVSEYMLQQTQVKRVLPKYKAFMKRFLTVRHLAEAKRKEVLLLWSGLGYNRRGIALHNAAKQVCAEYNGKFPETEEELRLLPGIGQYTASAIRAFAYNKETIMLETNIRTVILHHFFAEKDEVDDKEVKKYVKRVYKHGIKKGYDARTIYTALMDYGHHLKTEGVKINGKSKHYKQQSTFKGSKRQARGALLRLLLQTQNGTADESLLRDIASEKTEEALESLIAEGIIKKQETQYSLT